MRYRLASLCFLSLLLFAVTALAQNGDYSSYYSFTVTYNPDGSATVIPTAEVTGIDDVSDWVEGQYRPVCTVRPKIQLTGDSAWVGGRRVALGSAVDQVRTGQGLQVPADGSTVNLQFAVEVDANCSGAPTPSYYLYPTIANLNTWADIDPDIWSLIGFEPAQTNPPYWYQYCPSGDLCPVGYGVASIRNFVDFADFLANKVGEYTNNYRYYDVYQGMCSYTLSCPNGNQNASCPVPDPETIDAPCPYTFLISKGIYVKNFLGMKTCFPVGILSESSLPTNCH
jgi:hypothetical protein